MITDEEIERIAKEASNKRCTGYSACTSNSTILALIARLRTAEAIVAKLPLTADGVSVVPGMPVWERMHDHSRQTIFVEGMTARMSTNSYSYYQPLWASTIYSTESAARAASAALPGVQGGTEGAASDCPRCKGTGKYIRFAGLLLETCKVCNGTGRLDENGDPFKDPAPPAQSPGEERKP